jgi:23S rRNA (uracil1939-C5)-methyltransferase
VVFVENAVPGDSALVRLTRIRSNYAEARAFRIERPSAMRVEPRCKYFGTCGGCKWQQLDYSAQLRFKQEQVLDCFKRIGGFSAPEILPIIGADNKFYYRGKMEYSFAEKEWLTGPPGEYRDGAQAGTAPGTGIFLGLHVPRRYDKVLDIDECYLQSQTSNRILNFTRMFARQKGLDVYDPDRESGYLRFLVIRESKRTREIMVNLVTYADDEKKISAYTENLLRECPEVTTVVNTINSRKAQVAYGESEKTWHGSGYIREILGGKTFIVSAGSFFQTNTAQAEKLYGAAKELCALRSDDVVYDLYSGTGSIAIFISDAVREVVGIESAESAVEDARKNAQANGIVNCRFLAGDLKDMLTKDREWISSLDLPRVIIVDPPRTGLHPKVTEEILALAPEKIVYISCNPATQARDVKLLCGEKYRLIRLQPVDMFPHTYHIENIALLHRT